MATKKISLTGNRGPSAAHSSRLVYHSVHALLQTVREIAQFEDVLCELTHELKHQSPLSKGSRKELDMVLDGMPSHVFQSHLDEARAALAAKLEPEAATVKRAAKSVKGRGRSNNVAAPAAKKLGRLPSR